MRQYDYLDFNFKDLPERFSHSVNGKTYFFRLYYNSYDDSFHIDIQDQYNVPIVNGEKLVYGMPLWSSINDPRLPDIELTPLDDYGHANKVNALNFPSVVKLEFTNVTTDSDSDSDSDSDDSDSDSDVIDPSQVDDNDYGNDRLD